MISNYIKLAWRVLGRRKFFTLISLFGISFTLGILMVIFSFLQGELGTDSPMKNKDDIVLITSLQLRRIYYDTIPTMDTTMYNNKLVIDTTYEYKKNGTSRWNSDMNNGIGELYLSDLPSVENATIISSNTNFDIYINGIKETFSAVYADPAYWTVFNHKIIEGRSFDQTDMDQASKVIVVSTKAALKYYGTTKDVINQEMLINGDHYTVIGIFPDKSKIIPQVSPDLVIPYTNMELQNQTSFYHGYFGMIFQKKKDIDVSQVKEEIMTAANAVPLDHPSKPAGYNEVIFEPKTYNEMFAQGVYNDYDASKSLKVMTWVLFGLIVFFIVLPTLNLINLNVSRIMERSSEIGVRKAFGASKSNIISQFIIENIILTILGGIIGLGIAILLISYINNIGFLGTTTMSFNSRFFLYSFFITIIFGIISGLLPAYKMSKLNIVTALKSNKI